MRSSLLSLVLFLIAVALLAFGGCGYPKHIDPLLLTYPSARVAELSAQARAKDIGGLVYKVANTHSMEPVLMGDDYIVVDTRVPYEQVKIGQVINYHADWQPPPLPTVTHRAVVRDKDGLLVEGDNVRPEIDPRTGQDIHSEARWRVTKDSYVGVVDTIYRVQP
jgi:hypothetical protein